MRRYYVSRKTGQSLVEFALVLIMLLTVLFLIIQLGITFSIYISLANSAREAARIGAIHAPSTAQAPNQTFSQLQTAMDTEREAAMVVAIEQKLNPLIDNADVTRTFSYDPNPGSSVLRSGNKVTVTLSVTHHMMFLLGSRDVTLQASSEMRIEPGGGQ